MRAKERAKRVERVRPLLNAATGEHATVYCTAVRGPDPRPTLAIVIVGAIVVEIVLLAAVHLVIGFLLLLVLGTLLYQQIEKPLALVVTERGIVAVKRSNFTRAHTEVLGMYEPAALSPPNVQQRGGFVQVPALELWIRQREYQELLSGLATLATASAGAMGDPSVTSAAPPAVAGWYPVAGQVNMQGYWDGQRWSAYKQWNGTAWIDVPTAPTG